MNIQLKMEVGILGLGKRPCKMFDIFSYAFYFGQLGVSSVGKINVMPNKKMYAVKGKCLVKILSDKNQMLTNTQNNV